MCEKDKERSDCIKNAQQKRIEEDNNRKNEAVCENAEPLVSDNIRMEV